MLSEGQRNDINFAIPLLEHIDIEKSRVLADRGYDSQKLIISMKKELNQPSRPEKEQNLSVNATGGCIKSGIW